MSAERLKEVLAFGKNCRLCVGNKSSIEKVGGVQVPSTPIYFRARRMYLRALAHEGPLTVCLVDTVTVAERCKVHSVLSPVGHDYMISATGRTGDAVPPCIFRGKQTNKNSLLTSLSRLHSCWTMHSPFFNQISWVG